MGLKYKPMNDLLVHVWQEKVIIPTYAIGEPDRNPMFFEKRVYQGSSGVVYPHPVIEKIYDEKTDKEYNGVFLENKYLKIMILPELGGRVQMAYDKIGQRHFIYYNQVIKPALVGLCGPWISGGIEFNWPQHHRPSTFEPVDYSIEENTDGSKTIWVNEVERMFGTKGMAGFTLHPGNAYLEIKVKLFNRTSLPQTFLWWANPAVKVNDDYQSVFPPDVNAVFDHGKRDVSSFPIATGTYYKVDYAPGTDISRYKNIPVPTSYMAINSEYDFVGGYEHDTQAGVLHVADHHVSPGKKQWTWGKGDFGHAWDRNLTDEDGPYIELMTGVFTDNQPDFSWLMPYEEKTFTQYFLPYRELGLVKNATKDILVNVEKAVDKLVIKVFATSDQQKNTISIMKQDLVLLREDFDVSPGKVYTKSFVVGNDVTAENILLRVTNASGRQLIGYDPAKNRKNDFPEPANAALLPAEVENNEQLFLTGQHLEQYRHATYSPVPYYEEALRRDPKDIRNNNALGAWHLRRGQFAKAEVYFRAGIETMTKRNPNPYDGELYYNLGLSLVMQGKSNEAYDAFFKACWNSAWQDSGYFSLAQIDMARGDYEKAIEHVRQSLDRNAGNSKAVALHITALRKTGDHRSAIHLAGNALQKDIFNLSARYELYRNALAVNDAAQAQQSLNDLKVIARGYVHNYISYALDYAAAGLYEDAVSFLQLYLDDHTADVYPMVWYYLGRWQQLLGGNEKAKNYYQKGAMQDATLCFPNRIEDVPVLKAAIGMNPADAKAHYYLGNLLYDKRLYNEAIEQWELSAHKDDSFPTVLRNLGIAWFNKKNDPVKALHYYEKAFALDTSDARVLMELDQLYKRINKDTVQRLRFLEQHINLVIRRDDLYLERAALYNFHGNYDKAYDLIMQRKFHPWEGGEGRVSWQYVYSLVEMARQQLQSLQVSKAIALLEQAQSHPHNLGEGKLFGTAENDIFYWLGIAHEKAGQPKRAADYFLKATEGSSEPAAAMFYNDRPADKIFYQGLAWQKLGNNEKAEQVFSGLITYGHAHLNDEVKIDYFAVSLPNLLIFDDDLRLRNQLHCHYIMGLAHLGLNQRKEAVANFEKVLAHDGMHFGAKTHLLMSQQPAGQEISIAT
jgi:tetratricopeptide (TPR) repeat protein